MRGLRRDGLPAAPVPVLGRGQQGQVRHRVQLVGEVGMVTLLGHGVARIWSLEGL